MTDTDTNASNDSPAFAVGAPLSRDAVIAAMEGYVAQHKKQIADALREVTRVIQEGNSLYGAMGYPADIAQTFSNTTHLAQVLDPDTHLNAVPGSPVNPPGVGPGGV